MKKVPIEHRIKIEGMTAGSWEIIRHISDDPTRPYHYWCRCLKCGRETAVDGQTLRAILVGKKPTGACDTCGRGGRKPIVTEKVAALFGTLNDGEISRLTGIRRETLSAYRARKGIPAVRGKGRPRKPREDQNSGAKK